MFAALLDRLPRLSLPKTATAPFCPAEVRGAVAVPEALSPWKRMLRVAGPGLLVSVGYMDPATGDRHRGWLDALPFAHARATYPNNCLQE